MKLLILTIVIAVFVVVVKSNSPPIVKRVCSATKEFVPVCGTDNKTYPNKSSLGCSAENNPDLKVKHEGACTSADSATGQAPPM